MLKRIPYLNGIITGKTVVVYRLSIPHNKDILCNSFQLYVWDIWDGKERVDDERRNKYTTLN